jgi:hypothetical protein
VMRGELDIRPDAMNIPSQWILSRLSSINQGQLNLTPGLTVQKSTHDCQDAGGVVHLGEDPPGRRTNEKVSAVATRLRRRTALQRLR